MAPTCRILCLILIVFFAVKSSSSSDNRKTYIIHMDNHKISEQFESLNKEAEELYEEILQSTKISTKIKDDLEPEILYTYKHTMTGFSAKLTSEQYQLLTDMDGVLHIARDGTRTLQTTYSPSFLGLGQLSSGLSTAGKLNQTGSDVIIGLVDTGIWPEHVSFSDEGLSPIPSRWRGFCEEGTDFSASSCNRKLIGARAFFRGYEGSYGRINNSIGFRSARDSEGHGTHTASTAAGNSVPDASFYGMAKGVACGISYTSRIAAYKVCWKESCTDSDILAAIDQAVADGVDILSLSLVGDAMPYYQDSAIIAAFGAVQNGVFVSFSAGNTGPFDSTVNNVAPWVMTVAASSLDRGFLSQVKLSNGKTFSGASLFSTNIKNNTKQLPVVYKQTVSSDTTSAEYCLPGSLSPSLVKGKIVVCKRGLNYEVEKGSVVKSAGGAAMILLNAPSDGEELIADPHVLPAALLGVSEAKLIESYLTQNKSLTASITFCGTTFRARSPRVASFSSRGPSPVDPHVIKPDITAPGMNILAAWPPISSISELSTDNRRADFNILWGTSMSCPHVSGVAALIKSVHRDWSPAAIKSAIMTSAYTRDNTGNLISDFSESSDSKKFATPFAIGSGHVNPDKALDPGLVYDITGEDYLQYLCSINYTNAQVTIVARRNYKCPSMKDTTLQPGDLNYPSFAVNFGAVKTGKTTPVTYKRTVTNVGSANIAYKVLLDQPKGVKVSIVPRVLRFKEHGENKSYRVSFTESGDQITDRNVSLSSFGSLIWVGGKYSVRSPIAVTW